MFFITTDTKVSTLELLSRVFEMFQPPYLEEQRGSIAVVKNNNLNAIFHNCKKVDLSEYTVFISGNAFPDKTETLISALEKTIQRGSGKGLIHGNFNLIIFNKGTHKDNGTTFFVISDHHGTIPCFFSQENSVIKVSSILHLFLLDKGHLAFNEQSLLDYLCLGYVFPEESFWSAIKMLPKKKFLNVDLRSKSITLQDRDIETDGKEALPFQSLKECASVFFESLKQVIDDEFQFIKVKTMFLTGGSDTRILLSCMSQEQRSRLSYITYDSPSWSGRVNHDSIVAKLLSEAFNLSHTIHKIKELDWYPQSVLETFYRREGQIIIIKGQYGSELFGGAGLNKSSAEDFTFTFSKTLDILRNKLLKSLITHEHYKRIGSPWKRLNQKVLSIRSVSKEAAFIQETLLRSQFTSIYANKNVHTFLIPSRHHFFWSLLPYIDTRILDVYLRCPREFLLNYNLYEYIFTHFAEKKLIEIPFNSNMMRFVESLSKIKKEAPSDINVKNRSRYAEFFEKHYSSSLFENTFLKELSNADAYKIPEPFLSRICVITAFLLGLQNTNNTHLV